jgi:hypothetical protein
MISIHAVLSDQLLCHTQNNYHQHTHYFHTFENDKFSLSPSNDDERAAGDAR